MNFLTALKNSDNNSNSQPDSPLTGIGGSSTKSLSRPSTKTPNSPTDSLLSPVSKKLLLRKTHSHDSNDNNSNHSNSNSNQQQSQQQQLQSHQLSTGLDINPMPLPGGYSCDFIFGTSSKFRKSVMDKLGWKYIQMSPDIDGKPVIPPLPLHTLNPSSLLPLSPSSSPFRKSYSN